MRDLPTVLARYAALDLERDAALVRELGRTDLFFLLTILCGRADMRHPWLLARCDEVQADADGHLDLWPRDHRKSSTITFGASLQDILRDPEVTIGILSHTRPIAKGFLRQIKRELESNKLLLALYPEILWANPSKEAPTWSEDSGIVVRRKGNPKESTVEAWGLVDGQPTGKHFRLRVYDDVVTRENASSPEMRAKTLEAYEQSLNLGTQGGQMRMIGTRYHYADAYAEILSRGTLKPRIYKAEDDSGAPVLLTAQELADKRRDMGSYVFHSQMMMDPKQEGSVGFSEDMLRWYDNRANGNTYILVDPANAKKKKSDYTALWVVTLGSDQNYYVRWFTRDKLDLKERIDLVMWAHREYRPRRVGYEQYGMMADVQALKMEQDRQSYRFDVVELGGRLAKYDRIMGLLPLFEAGRVYFPNNLSVAVKWADTRLDMVAEFKRDEFLAWPYAVHDDMLDCLARIVDPDLGAVFPRGAPPQDSYQSRREQLRKRSSSTGSWVTL